MPFFLAGIGFSKSCHEQQIENDESLVRRYRDHSPQNLFGRLSLFPAVPISALKWCIARTLLGVLWQLNTDHVGDESRSVAILNARKCTAYQKMKNEPNLILVVQARARTLEMMPGNVRFCPEMSAYMRELKERTQNRPDSRRLLDAS